jgi:hypothetical protein
MIVDKVWKLTNTVRVGLDVRSSTNTGEGGKGKRHRTVSDDVGGKSLSETSKSVCGHTHTS